ncbi:peptide/nickel transport system permease protein [Tistlia consotensis]|uniref:Peptide/nickel transport system permease protein n=1 Tax=Tistlia consotensis USBA 355 TaxID=560819 RepID=A0A1Y6BYW9_9PROT|nr:ABC transporter permease [Tistlia consotensis]SMF36534.1 peptide/nickel transport system permease protein [Tistlia consotensis USBA 355]SNR72071.1 peptide/nickel transport system permease protein [Tistlia consotensis]
MSGRRSGGARLLASPSALIGLAGIAAIVLLAALAPLLPLSDPLAQQPYGTLAGPSLASWLGTDNQGRDVLSRVIFGAQTSLLISLVSIGLAMVLGTLLGVVAGYYRGYAEVAIMRVADSLMAFPSLILGVAIMAILGSGTEKVILCLTIVMTPRFVRIAYGSAMAVRVKEYIEAAQAVSAPFHRILAVHIVPNIFSEILVVAILWIGTAIQVEASLSFIGIGVSPPTPTWGNMIKSGLDYLPIAPWMALAPSAAIFLTIVFFNLVGDSIRDVVDPRHYG